MKALWLVDLHRGDTARTHTRYLYSSQRERKAQMEGLIVKLNGYLKDGRDIGDFLVVDGEEVNFNFCLKYHIFNEHVGRGKGD